MLCRYGAPAHVHQEVEKTQDKRNRSGVIGRERSKRCRAKDLRCFLEQVKPALPLFQLFCAFHSVSSQGGRQVLVSWKESGIRRRPSPSTKKKNQAMRIPKITWAERISVENARRCERAG